MGRSRRSLKTPQKVCLQCKIVVKEDEEDFIECDKCRQVYHVICTSLDKRGYEYYLNNENEEFFCHLCNNSGTIDSDIKQIKKELEKLEKLDQLSAMSEAMNFMSKQFDDIMKSVAENKKKLELITKENKQLKAEVESLKNCVKILNNDRVRNDCIIRGLEATGQANAVEAVINLTKDAGVEINRECIDDAYFINNDRKTTKTKKMVVVKFNNKHAKGQLMSIKPKLKANENTKKVFINDYLSKENLSLLNYAKTLKSIGYATIFPSGGRVFVKVSELSKPRLIRSEADVDELLLDATTRRKTGHVPQQAEL